MMRHRHYHGAESGADIVVVKTGDVPIVGPVRPADVGFGAHPFDHVRVVQLERGPLRTDPGQLSEVVPRRRTAGGPLPSELP